MASTPGLTEIGQELEARFVRMRALLDVLGSADTRVRAELSVIRRVFDASGEAMFALNVRGDIVSANAHAQRLLAVPEGKLIGTSFSAFLPGGVESNTWKTLETRLRRAERTSGASLELPAELSRRGGGTFPSRLTISPVSFEGGDPLVSIVVRRT